MIRLGALPHRITIHRRRTITRDAHLNDIRTTTSTSVGVPARVDPVDTEEDKNARDHVTDRVLIIALPDADLAADDWIEFEGNTYALDGNAQILHNGTGQPHHLEATAHRRRG